MPRPVGGELYFISLDMIFACFDLLSPFDPSELLFFGGFGGNRTDPKVLYIKVSGSIPKKVARLKFLRDIFVRPAP
jgi:hypothetical protein